VSQVVCVAPLSGARLCIIGSTQTKVSPEKLLIKIIGTQNCVKLQLAASLTIHRHFHSNKVLCTVLFTHYRKDEFRGGAWKWLRRGNARMRRCHAFHSRGLSRCGSHLQSCGKFLLVPFPTMMLDFTSLLWCFQNKMEVSIWRVSNGVKDKNPVVKVAQRDLFRKNGWPAKSRIIASLQEMDT
jgi:hypothetical protein